MDNKRHIGHLQRCIELAGEAVEAGDEPFGSVLVSGDNEILFEDRNRVNTKGDPTRHPEFAIARWAVQNLTPEERDSATVYTSGEPCPMCAAAHGLVGIGCVVFASSAAQLSEWQDEFTDESLPVKPLPIEEVVPGIEVEGPAPELAHKVRDLHRRFHSQK